MGNYKTVRVFDGKKYFWYDSVKSPMEADDVKREARKKGYKYFRLTKAKRTNNLWVRR